MNASTPERSWCPCGFVECPGCGWPVRVEEPAEKPVGDETEALRAQLGAAETLLGEYGAGGTPAGLIGGIHNLAHQAEMALERVAGLEAREARLRRALSAIAEDTGYRGGVLSVGTRASAFDFARDLARAALADSGEAGS